MMNDTRLVGGKFNTDKKSGAVQRHMLVSGLSPYCKKIQS